MVGVCGVCGDIGGSWSREKLVLFIKRSVVVEADGESMEGSFLRISMLEFMFEFVWPSWPVEMLRPGRLDDRRFFELFLEERRIWL